MDENKIIVKVDPDLEDLIPRFMENTRQDLDAIAHALTENDLETIRRIGHSMKSYGAGYGFEYISTSGRAIEAAAISRDLSAIEKCLSTFNHYLDHVEVIYG